MKRSPFQKRTLQRLIAPDEAWRVLCRTLAPMPVERLPLQRATGRYLARAIKADRDIPAADRAAMDGFAVRAKDTPGRLRIVGEVAAGSSVRPRIRAGEAVRIFTGANIPPGADAVIAVEDTSPAASDAAEARIAVPAGRHILRRGEFARRGAVLLPAHSRLDPAAVAVCAAVGCAAPVVYAVPQIAILATGSELRPVTAERVGPEAIRDSNGPLLRAALTEQGFPVAASARVPDNPDALGRRLKAALARHDVVILSGGVSVGDYDWVPDVIRAAGARIRYHGVAMKPGKPQLFATAGAQRYVFGLPGNPLSATVGLHEFVLPALRLVSGCPADECRPLLRLPLGAPLRGAGGRRLLIPARWRTDSDRTVLDPLPPAGSADFITAAKADGAILLPAGATDLPASAIVEFRPWRAP